MNYWKELWTVLWRRRFKSSRLFSLTMIRRFRWTHLRCCRVLENLKFNEKMTTCADQHFFFDVALKYKVAHLPGIVGVWNRDNRPDQLTNRNLLRKYKNWKILCENFGEQVRKYPEVRRFYFGKLAALALYNRDIIFSIKSVLKLLKE